MPHEHDDVAAAAAEIGPHLTAAGLAVCKTWAALKRVPHGVARRRLSRTLADIGRALNDVEADLSDLMADLPEVPRREPVVERVDLESLQTALLLTDFEEVSLDSLQAWPEADRRAAYEWAILEHLSANDNDVQRAPMPECVRQLKEAHDAPA